MDEREGCGRRGSDEGNAVEKEKDKRGEQSSKRK